MTECCCIDAMDLEGELRLQNERGKEAEVEQQGEGAGDEPR